MERDAALEAVFKPVRPPSTFEETVERLGTAIRLGLLAPGARLPSERELAGELRISRSTLRQALTTLVQSGHLVSRRGRAGGTFVVGAAAASRPGRRAAGPGVLVGPRLPGRDRVRLGPARLRAGKRGAADAGRGAWSPRWRAELEDFEEYRRTDIRFHIAIAEAAGSPRLVSAMTETQGQMTDLIALIAHPAEVLGRSNDQHRRLAELMRAGDGAGAVRLMRDHIEGTEHILTGLLPVPPVEPLGASG